MPKLDAQISALQDRLTQLKQQQQRADARRRALESQRQRKAQTRRNVLVGALILAKVRGGEMDENLLREWLDRGLTRASDRALFELDGKNLAQPPP